ncbi:MFS transporter, OPA family, glycerol-3-phosphate transporter [Oscillibacter sp. PC13]|uniref:MFS transporter n=1 Tax=Oscillibacter sp. PC13 TaxID=1855299 RepID=UPI0008E01B51|nr:MFS transporter [Oscillibacter sp. PC13]SFP87797.1 MFS transporter, OPA family, glycerol-3-phosphate transporter [Oscillibacter sp. PC13]
METSSKTYGYSQTDYTKFKKYAKYMLLGFGFTYMFFYNGRQNMSLAMPVMAEAFGTTKAEIGFISSALFWCYGFGHLFSGRLGEIVGNKRFMIVGIIVSAICNFTISFQSSLAVIAVLWGLNGFAQSMVWSPGLGVLNKWWPKEKRGFASGVATGFSGVAQVVTYGCVFAAYAISPDWGWRAAFRWPLIPMLLILVVFAVFVKNQPEDIGLKPFEEPDAAAAAEDEKRVAILKTKSAVYPYKLLFSEPKVILLCFISAIAGIGRYGLLTWIPTYFTDVMGMDIKTGILSSILLPLGQALAMFVFPTLTDKVFKGKREPMLLLAAVVSVVLLCVFPFVKSQMMASALLLLVGCASMVTGVIWAISGDLGGRAMSGTTTGILDWAIYMGSAAQSMIFGVVLDKTGSWPAIFITIAVLYVIMVILTFIVRSMKMTKLEKAFAEK